MDLSVKVMCMAWCRCSSGRAAEKARPGDSNGPTIAARRRPDTIVIMVAPRTPRHSRRDGYRPQVSDRAF